MAIVCPACSQRAEDVASEETSAIGGCVCSECGWAGFSEDFEFVDDDEYDGESVDG